MKSKSLANRICSVLVASTFLFSSFSPATTSIASAATKAATSDVQESDLKDLNSEAYKERLQKIIDEFDRGMDQRLADSESRFNKYVSLEQAEQSESDIFTDNAPSYVPVPSSNFQPPSLNAGRYTFDWQGTPLNKSLYAVAKLAKMNVVVHGKLEDTVYTSLNNVTCEEALNFLGATFNFNWRIEGNTIVVSTEDKMLQSREFSISYANKDMLVKEMMALGFEEKNVFANPETGTVSVTGTSYQISEAARRIRSLDHPVSQVLVLAQMIEVNHGDNLDLGMQYSLPTFTHTGTDDSTSRNLPGNVWEKMTFGFISQANKSLSKGKVVARPMVMMLNGQEGTVNFGDQVPVLNQTSTSSSTNVTVDYKDVGTKLKIRPVINESLNEVTLAIEAEVSTITQWKNLGSTQAPQISSRKATTSAHIKSGNSVIIGGLLSAVEMDNLSGIPFLMDLPILGKLFSFHSKSKTYGEVFIQITPYIVSNDLDPKALARQVEE